MIIECLPKGLCSWDYRLRGPSLQAELHFDWVGEHGNLHVNQQKCDIRREGFFNKEWQLLGPEGLIAIAEKLSAFHRHFRIYRNGINFDLRASGFGRTMELSGAGHRVVYRPKHLFTRRGEIDGGWDDPVVVTFGFWLTVLMWRRMANSNASGGGGAGAGG